MDIKSDSMIQTPDRSVHEYVDLGLPSGTLWATENIKDASGNELYFAWGETTGYTAEQVQLHTKKFDWDDYKFGVREELTKYNRADGLIVLKPEDDTAIQNWGTEWKMPTKEQFDELLEETNQDLVEVDGTLGLLCTSKTNGNTLFLPTFGYAVDGGVFDIGCCGSYWSASLNYGYIYNAWNFDFYDGYHEMGNDYRYYGYPVRPVRV